MDERLGDKSNMSFINTRIDGQIALDESHHFLYKEAPGFLEINFDKAENNYESFSKSKSHV
jgi:hypothetical protein